MGLENFSTKELTEELMKREGISFLNANLEDNVWIKIDHKNEMSTASKLEGPALIIINQD